MSVARLALTGVAMAGIGAVLAVLAPPPDEAVRTVSRAQEIAALGGHLGRSDHRAHRGGGVGGQDEQGDGGSGHGERGGPQSDDGHDTHPFDDGRTLKQANARKRKPWVCLS